MKLYSLYIYSLILPIVNNKPLTFLNNEVHEYNTRNNNNFQSPSVLLNKLSTGPYISGIRPHNHLSQIIKTLDHNSKQLEISLKRCFYQHPFYSMEDYSEYKDESP